MDTKKFEQLITLYLNEGNEEKARALFHDIIVEKSREIYESMLDLEEGSQVEDLMQEVQMDEYGMNEAEDEELDMDDMGDEEGMDDMEDMDDMGDEEGDLDDMGDVDDADMEDMEDMGAEEGELEDRVVDLEDKLDELMAEFEELMGKEEGDEEAADDEEMAADDEEDAADDEEMAAGDEEEAADEEEEEMMESKLMAVKKPSNTSPASHGPALTSPKVKTDRNPVNFSGTGGTGRAAPKAKEVSGAGSFANKGGGSVSLKSVAKPAAGQQAQNTKSPVAESRKAPAKRK